MFCLSLIGDMDFVNDFSRELETLSSVSFSLLRHFFSFFQHILRFASGFPFQTFDKSNLLIDQLSPLSTHLSPIAHLYFRVPSSLSFSLLLLFLSSLFITLKRSFYFYLSFHLLVIFKK